MRRSRGDQAARFPLKRPNSPTTGGDGRAYWPLPGESAWPTLLARALEIKAVDGISGEILSGLRLKVQAQAVEVLSDLEKCEGGLVVRAINADDDLVEFLKPRIGLSQLAAQFPVFF